MDRSSAAWTSYVLTFVNILLVFAAVLAINGFYFLNLDGWRYSGAHLGAPQLAPVMLAVFNYPAYTLFGTWGEMILQILVFSYVLTRTSAVFGFRVSLLTAIVWLVGTFYAFFGNTFVVDPWTPILLLLLLIVGYSRRLNYLDLFLLFVAAGAHNLHVLIAIGAFVVGIATGLIVRRRLVIALTILATIPVNMGLAHVLHPGVTPLRWSFIASDVLLKDTANHEAFCQSNAENKFCRDPYLAKIRKGRAEGWYDLMWGAHSLFIDSPELGGKPLTVSEVERASREFVFYIARHDPLLFVTKGLRGLNDVVFSNPMNEFSWAEWAAKALLDPWYSYLAPYSDAINKTLQTQHYFTQPRVWAFGKFALALSYATFLSSFLVAMIRRDWLCVRLHAYVLIVFLAAGTAYAVFSIMLPRYYFRNLVLLGVPILFQLARIQAEWPRLRAYASSQFEKQLAKLGYVRTNRQEN
jgi:hypothetical protein